MIQCKDGDCVISDNEKILSEGHESMAKRRRPLLQPLDFEKLSRRMIRGQGDHKSWGSVDRELEKDSLNRNENVFNGQSPPEGKYKIWGTESRSGLCFALAYTYTAETRYTSSFGPYALVS